MKKVFILGTGSISSQKTFDNDEFLDELQVYNDNLISVVAPNYKEYIPVAAARRMARGVKMGVVASKIALIDAKLENVDAIITGTGMGCLIDSEKFVGAIIENQEEYLTPTSFIQSTHNTVAGQIALGINCKGYNFTYVHSSISFESALMDTEMQLKNDEASNILVGGVDEIGEHTMGLHKLIGHIKSEKVSSDHLLEGTSTGTIFSEGANFFVLSNHKSDHCYAELVAVETYNTLAIDQLQNALISFLKVNQLMVVDIDILILGNNGDSMFDNYYSDLSSHIFVDTQQLSYKHLCGEFNTASSFGFWLAVKILKFQRIPNIVKMNNIEVSEPKIILLYNQYRGENHSFILLRKC